MIVAYNRLSETPYDTLVRIQQEYQLATAKLVYTGRLDPMAQGILPLLLDEEAKQLGSYLHHDKTYTAEAVLGLATDTYDAMGLITDNKVVGLNEVAQFQAKLQALSGTTIKQQYPIYSAYRIKNKQLHWWVKQGRIDEIRDKIPVKERQIYQLDLIETQEVSLTDYAQQVCAEISLVRGEFRQQEIISQWQRIAQTNPARRLYLVKFQANVASGTYIRTLVHQCLEGLPAHAHAITRTKYGPWTMDHVGTFQVDAGQLSAKTGASPSPDDRDSTSSSDKMGSKSN